MALGTLLSTGLGLAAGAGKAALEGAQESRERKLSADQMKWSPWTGMQPQAVQGANPAASILSGLGAGLAASQGAKRDEQDEAYRQRLLGIMERQAEQQPSTNIAASSGPSLWPDMPSLWMPMLGRRQ